VSRQVEKRGKGKRDRNRRQKTVTVTEREKSWRLAGEERSVYAVF
jgi:hypothetical protein